MNQEQGQRGDAVAGGLVEGLLRALEAERERSKEAERQVRLLYDVSARLNFIHEFHVEFLLQFGVTCRDACFCSCSLKRSDDKA